jgi:hypothetical protein
LNRDNLVLMIDRYLFSLNRFKHEIMARDEKRLEVDLIKSSNVRRGME